MIALPREHLLCRQRASRGDTGGGCDAATSKPPGQRPLPFPRHAASYAALHASKGCCQRKEPDGARETPEGLRCKGNGTGRGGLVHIYFI